MANQQIQRARIFSMMTQSRFLHIEDALTPIEEGKPGKVRFFIGAYQKGSGQPATTAHHFLDDDEARVVFTDMSWGKQLDIKDYKGTVNGEGAQSRVLKIKGPTDKGKYWLQVSMGPGEIIGQGAVKPKGKPEVEVSIPLTIWQARKLALAVLEYMSAWRVATFFGTTAGRDRQTAGTQSRHVDPGTGEITGDVAAFEAPGCNSRRSEPVNKASSSQDAEDLFGPEPAPRGPDPESKRAEKPPPAPVIASEAKQSPPAEDKPTSFYKLAPVAITDHGLLDLVQELVRGPLAWHEKTQRLQAAMAA